ncbi:MAG: hypothetical protein K0S65_496 [Labilithrix sp.]|nr:hypothetical protein [Labilithrix sp.]
MTLVFLLLGLAAGALTTVAGQGGGLLLLLVCAAVTGPREALAITAPALLLGNLHRAFLLRTHIDRSVALRIVLGAVPGALAGGLLVGVTPAWVLRLLLVAMTVGAVAKAFGLVRFEVSRRALVPAGVVLGAMTGTSGGAGVLFAPVLLSAGLSGLTFVATSSTVAFATHVGRVIGYAGLGLFEGRLLGPTVAVAVAIFAGNAFGGRVHRRLTSRQSTVIEYVTLVVCVVLSVAGLG